VPNQLLFHEILIDKMSKLLRYFAGKEGAIVLFDKFHKKYIYTLKKIIKSYFIAYVLNLF